jgi:signal transduction histidine kinase
VDFSSTALTVGGVQSWLWTAFDITDRKQAEEQRRALEAALAQVQKMDSIGTLVAGLAHHFNNLLAIIQGYAQRLERTPAEPSRVSQSARAIENAAHRGVALIQQLIGVTRKANIQFTPVPVNILIRELTVLMREIFPPTVALVHDLASASLQIAGEYHQLHQVLMNICLNARDAMTEGGTLTISSSIVQGSTLRGRAIQADPVDYVRIAVTDTGTGMGEDIREHIYEPFFTTKDRALHTGMGMSVVYGIVASHRGYVEVESAAGKGTTVFLYLPAFTVPGSRPSSDSPAGVAP